MFVPVKNAAVEEFYARFQSEVSTFEKQFPSLILQYPGEYVGIYKGNVVAHMEKWEDVAKFAREHFPNEFVLIEKVASVEKVPVDMDTLEG